jgi:radical SAM-linked protein
MLRYLSHRELMTAIMRALKRAGVPVLYTKGFHPNPDVSFGPPLNVGIAGLSEYFDMEVAPPFDVQLYRTLLNSSLPEGIHIDGMSAIRAGAPSLTGFVSRYEYYMAYTGETAGAAEPRLLYTGGPLMADRDGKETDISVCVESVARLQEGDLSAEALFDRKPAAVWRVIVRETESVKVRLGEMVHALFGCGMEDLQIVRAGMYGWKDGWRKPL